MKLFCTLEQLKSQLFDNPVFCVSQKRVFLCLIQEASYSLICDRATFWVAIQTIAVTVPTAHKIRQFKAQSVSLHVTMIIFNAEMADVRGKLNSYIILFIRGK